MTATAQSIIDFLEARASSAPLSSADLSALVSDLKSQINQLSATVPSATPDSITVFYSAKMPDGTTHAGAVAQALVEANAPGKVLTLNQTEVYSLLNSDDFKTALNNALGNDEVALNRILNGSVAGGQRVPDGFWDDASRRFAQNAVGEVRVIAPNGALNTVFAQTELPALLANSRITAIEEIGRAHV